MPPGLHEFFQSNISDRSNVPSTTHEDLLRLTGVLSDASLSPAERLAVYDDIVGLNAAANLHAGAAADDAPSSVTTTVLASAGPYPPGPAQQQRYIAGQPEAGKSHHLLEEEQTDQELQRIISSTYLAVDSHGPECLPSQDCNNALHNKQQSQLASLHAGLQQLRRKRQPQEQTMLQQHSAMRQQQPQPIAQGHRDQQEQQMPPDISQLMKNGQPIHQQLYLMFLQQPQPHEHCVPDGCIPPAQYSQQHTPEDAAGTVSTAGFHGADLLHHNCIPEQGSTAVARAQAAGVVVNSRSSSRAPLQSSTTDAAAAMAVTEVVGGTSSDTVPGLKQHKQHHRHTTKPSSHDESWLPTDCPEGQMAINSESRQCDTALATGPDSLNAQQQEESSTWYEPDALNSLPPSAGPVPGDDCSKDGPPAVGGTRVRVRRNKVAELQQSVQALRLQVSQLCESNTALRQQEQQLEGQLAQKESTVAAMLAKKHEAVAWQPGHEQQTAGQQLAPLSSFSSSSAQQAESKGCRLAEPSLGYHPSAFKQDYLPTVNGGLPSPGTFPMFCPLPQSAVLVSAKNITRFVQDARELRAAHAGTDAEQAVEDHLLMRISTLQGLMRRYNVMNPVFMYQLRAVNLSTGQPDTPPVGHWAAMAGLMTGMITAQETKHMKMSFRLFQASLRAVKKEQAWVVSQIITTSKRLQSSMAGCADQQHQGSNGSTAVLERVAVERVDVESMRPSAADESCGGQGSAQLCSTHSSSSHALSDSRLLEQLQLQQQLDDLLRQMQQLLLREHDQHFILLWSCAKMPSSIKVFMELLLASYPYLVNYHEILPHLFTGV